jgi:hypothetical protein
MFIRTQTIGSFTLAFTTLTGCGPARLDVLRTFDLAANSVEILEMSAQERPQKFTVEFSADTEVSVLLFRKADVPDPDAATYAATDKALGFRKGLRDSFTVEVPGNTATTLVVRGGPRGGRVELKLTNRK